jgi:hypothetical protein
MAAQLGIGVRVRIGWAPAAQFATRFDSRFKIGTIVRGPLDLKGGEVFLGSRMVGGRYWSVDVCGHLHCTHESLLLPFDGGDSGTELVDEELEVTA